ncbi:MAG TPA: rhamnogalacturonan acetylesterase [Vicinamibacterales bacterium]|nr:rhamnogalacturonan acetylesterase [Vicinamibacterales bacterium]
MRAAHLGAFLSLAAALWPAAGATAPQTPGERARIVLVGDSTVAEGQGWGPGFRAWFGADVDVVNLALNGRSSKSFLDEGAWTAETPRGANYVLIQFGHNDNPGKGPDRETSPTTTYRANLVRYVTEARAAGAVPILVTSIVRRNLTADGHVKTDALLPYVEEVRRLAAERHILLMDMYALSLRQCESLGPAGCAALNATTADGGPDTTHLNAVAQQAVGEIAAREFTRVVLPAQPNVDPRTVPAATWLPLNRVRTTFDLPEPSNRALPSIVVVGDSTVRNGRGVGADGLWGWGEPFAALFDPARVNVVNRAISGLSSRTYTTLGHWDRTLALFKRGDVLVMQFGHNDASPINDPTRARGSRPGTGDDEETIDNLMTGDREVVHTFGWYERRMIDAAQSRGVTVVVCSPVPRNTWKDGKIVQAEDYRRWSAGVARDAHALYVDLSARLSARYEALGQARVATFFPRDNTHTNRDGATFVAGEVAAALRALPASPIAAYLK